MKAWFMQLALRERRIVIFGAAMLIIVLIYVLIWEPLVKHRQQLRQTVTEQQALVEWMQQAAQEAGQLRAVKGGAAGKLPEGQSLLAVVDQSAKSSGLGAAMKRVEPEGHRGQEGQERSLAPPPRDDAVAAVPDDAADCESGKTSSAGVVRALIMLAFM